MESSTIKRSKVISTVMNNPITFLLSQLHNPSNLISIFTSPIPVSFPFQPSQFTKAELLVLIALVLASSVVGLTIMWMLIIVSSPIWIPVTVALSLLAVGLFSVFGFGAVAAVAVTWLMRRFFPTHTQLESPLEK